ncbi:DNA primase [Sphaerotilus hippei]|uniref:DNA primase n=1 Tax=Sphaerotilus hippei TaxID=744406 RepID=A0A318GYI4_9BURK|nr:DNA primase [Sphaerotilus hippei]PXW95024.1 DNA primase [Sphaerotilus hippei]
MIPQGFIQDLLARADIVDVVGRAVPLKKAGINYKGLCPFHGEKSPSFVVSPSRQTYHCFGCGAHGNAVGFLMEHTGLGFVEAVRELAQEMGVTVPEDDVSPEERARAAQARERQVSLTEVMARAAAHYRGQLKASPRAVDYLKARGLTGDIAARFGLGYAPAGRHTLASCYPKYDDPQLVEAGLVIHRHEPGEEERRYDRFRDRIMFPIRNPKGEVIGFGGRIIDAGEPKYLNSPETPLFVKGRELYGLFEARTSIRERGHVLVTEGYMDVVALAQLGVPNAVATLGTACSGEHVAKLLRFSEHIVFSFDGDAAGRRAAGRAMEAVLPHASDTRSFRFLFLPAEHDPDSFIRAHGTEAFERCIAEAVPLSTQLIHAAREGCDLATPEGRARMLAQARPLLEQLPSGLLREQLLVELARDGGLSPEVLAHHWQESASRQAARAGPRGAEPSPRRTAPAPAATGPAGPDAPWADWDQPDGLSSGPPPDHVLPPLEAEGGHGGWSSGAAAAPSRPNREPYQGGGGRSGDRPWNRKGGPDGGKRPWKDRNAPFEPRLPPPRTTTLLDRAAWLLVHDIGLWLQLSAALHDLLVEQPAPYGPFFAALDRLVNDQGPLPADTVTRDLQQLAEADEASGLSLLLRRLQGLHELIDTTLASGELQAVLHRLRLQSVEDEIGLLLESGDLSDEAVERRNHLMQLRARLKKDPENADA